MNSGSQCNIRQLNNKYSKNMIDSCTKKQFKKVSFTKISYKQYKQLYQKKECIGSGSYGDVFRAIDKNGNQVAIKEFRNSILEDSQIIQVSIMNQLKHPNVLAVLGCYIVQMATMKPILVTEYCENGDLGQIMSKLNSEQLKLSIAVQIARGMSWIHSNNYMHRDIKPQNILVTNDYTVKICDFGFGKLDCGITKTALVGTPSYAAPQIKTGVYSKKCDVFSVGVVIIFLFTGKGLFQGSRNLLQLKKKQQLFFKQFQKSTRQLQIPQYIKPIIKATLTENPQQRYQSSMLLTQLLKAYNIKFPNIAISKTESQYLNNQKCLQQPILIQVFQQQQFSQYSLHIKKQIQSKLRKSNFNLKFMKLLDSFKKKIKQIKVIAEFQLLSNDKKQLILFIILLAYIKLMNSFNSWANNSWKSEKANLIACQLFRYHEIDFQRQNYQQESIQKIMRITKGELDKYKPSLFLLRERIYKTIELISLSTNSFIKQIAKKDDQSLLLYIQQLSMRQIRNQYIDYVIKNCQIDQKLLKLQVNINSYKKMKGFLNYF